jgi:hypothetical protein
MMLRQTEMLPKTVTLNITKILSFHVTLYIPSTVVFRHTIHDIIFLLNYFIVMLSRIK